MCGHASLFCLVVTRVLVYHARSDGRCYNKRLLHANCRRESMMRERRENRCNNKKEDMSLILPCIRAWTFSPHKNHVYYTEAGRCS